MSLVELELIEELFSPAQKEKLIEELKNAMVNIRTERSGRTCGCADDQDG